MHAGLRRDSLWFLKRETPDAADARAARTEADKRGAAAHHARFSIQLLTDDTELLRLADTVFEPVDRLSSHAGLGVFAASGEMLLTAWLEAPLPYFSQVSGDHGYRLA